jgi:2-polyprenyl-3-methyl-5-hydroxy-6-metoxy-1,4-benzoquinol methylase
MTSVIHDIQSAPEQPTIDQQKDYWDCRWDKTRTPNDWMIRRGQTILSFLSGVKLERPKFLDIGCGTGWFAAELAKIGSATGIDLSEEAIGLARSQYPNVTYIAGDLYENHFSDNFFDVVVAQEVIPHVQDQERFLEIIGGILKPDGYLVLTMVNKFVMDRSDWDHGPSSHIIKWLSKKEIKQKLQPHFKILKTTTVIPIGDKGIMKLINSYKLNKILKFVFSQKTIDNIKERAGLGYTRMIYAKMIN